MNEDRRLNTCPHCQTQASSQACTCRPDDHAGGPDNIIPFARRPVQHATRTPPLSDPDGPTAA